MRGLTRLQEALLVSGVVPIREALMDKVVKTIPYKGFTITVYEVHSERFGRLFWANNDTGEPYLDSPKMWPDMNKAITVAKGDVDDYTKDTE